jgi:hypothetical protein
LAARGDRVAGCHNRVVLIRQVALSLGVFVGATLLALLFGAKNLGTALTFGQIAFAATVFGLMMFSARPGARGRKGNTS